MNFVIPVDHKIKMKESEKKDKSPDLARELKNNYGICRWWWYQSQLVPSEQSPKIDKRTGRLGNQRASGEYNLIKISQNSEKCLGDLWRLAASQTSTKNHQLTLMWKTQKVMIIIIIMIRTNGICKTLLLS